MYSINIKGKVTSKDKKLVKLEMIFFQTGYNRVSKSAKYHRSHQRLGQCVTIIYFQIKRCYQKEQDVA